MAGSGFYDAGLLKQVAINLFYGWGYNFYRAEDQLRADDQLVRSKVGWLLGRAHSSLDEAESAYRRDFLPSPSRAKPFPDPAAVSGAQAIEQLSRAIGALSGQIASQPVPAEDRMTQRYRQEAATLAHLIEIDQTLVGQAELLRASIDGKTGSWIIENQALLSEGIQSITKTLVERDAVLR